MSANGQRLEHGPDDALTAIAQLATALGRETALLRRLDRWTPDDYVWRETIVPAGGGSVEIELPAAVRVGLVTVAAAGGEAVTVALDQAGSRPVAAAGAAAGILWLPPETRSLWLFSPTGAAATAAASVCVAVLHEHEHARRGY